MISKTDKRVLIIAGCTTLIIIYLVIVYFVTKVPEKEKTEPDKPGSCVITQNVSKAYQNETYYFVAKEKCDGEDEAKWIQSYEVPEDIWRASELPLSQVK